MTDGPDPVEAHAAPSSPRSARRRLTFVLLAGVLAIIGALVAGYYFAMRPVTLRIAVGPANSEDLRVVQALAQALNNQQHGHVRLRPLLTEGALASANLLGESKADLAIIEGQLDEVMGRRARLEAERDDAAAPSFPPELLARANDPKIAKILSGQRKLFESETASLKGQKDQLEQRMTQLEEEIRGLNAQLDSNEKQTKLINEELKAFKGLVAKGLIELTRVRERQGAAASLEGQQGEIIANIAQAQGKISEIRLQIIQLQDDARVKVLADLGDAETKMAELLERQGAAESKLARTTIRSPVTGYVYHVSVHTIGGVVGAGETILEIVPQFDDLVLAAHARPQDARNGFERARSRTAAEALFRFPSSRI